MSLQQVNQITAVVGIVLIVIIFALLATGAIPGLVAIVLTLGVGLVIRFLRSVLVKP